MKSIVALLGLCLMVMVGTESCQNSEKGSNQIVYQCPMKCEGDKTYSVEGNCPVCKMKITEVK